MTSHIPVNHPLRPMYRALAAIAGLYVLIFGIVGFTRTRGTGLFAQEHLPSVLGLRTNLAFALVSIAAGIVIIVSAAVGRNIDYMINLVAGVVFMAVGMIMLGLMNTNANFLGFSMTNCVVSFVLGMAILAAGLYAKTGPKAAQNHG
jgi:hypothetical protein